MLCSDCETCGRVVVRGRSWYPNPVPPSLSFSLLVHFNSCCSVSLSLVTLCVYFAHSPTLISLSHILSLLIGTLTKKKKKKKKTKKKTSPASPVERLIETNRERHTQRMMMMSLMTLTNGTSLLLMFSLSPAPSLSLSLSLSISHFPISLPCSPSLSLSLPPHHLPSSPIPCFLLTYISLSPLPSSPSTTNLLQGLAGRKSASQA